MKQLQDLIDGNAAPRQKTTQKKNGPRGCSKRKIASTSCSTNSAQIDKTKILPEPDKSSRTMQSRRRARRAWRCPRAHLRSFVEFAGRDELKGDYDFANRAQRRHAASKRSNGTRARLEDECRFLQSRVHEAIEKELAGDERVKERLRAVSKQATDFFSKIYISIYDTALESAGKQAKDAYDKAIQKLTAGASGNCYQRCGVGAGAAASSAAAVARAVVGAGAAGGRA